MLWQYAFLFLGCCGLGDWLSRGRGGVGVVGVVVESFISLDGFFEFIFGDR